MARATRLRGARAALDLAVPDRLQRGAAPAVAAPAAAGDPEHRGRGDLLETIPEAPHLGPESQTLGRELEAALDRSLAELPIDLRAAVVLRDIEGLSTEEAAAVVGVRQAAFKSRLHRGRMQLRALLEPYLALERG